MATENTENTERGAAARRKSNAISPLRFRVLRVFRGNLLSPLRGWTTPDIGG
jgi:hypothetical protein